MTLVAAIAAALIGLLLVLQHRERAAHEHQLGVLLRKTEFERTQLLERIQHPHRTLVEPGEPEVHALPDSPEMAKLGQIFYEDENTTAAHEAAQAVS